MIPIPPATRINRSTWSIGFREKPDPPYGPSTKVVVVTELDQRCLVRPLFFLMKNVMPEVGVLVESRVAEEVGVKSSKSFSLSGVSELAELELELESDLAGRR